MCNSGITHLPSSLPHHCSFFASDQPAYRICIPRSVFPASFSDQFITKSRDCSVLPPLQLTYTDIRPTDSNLAGLTWAKEMGTNKSTSSILLLPSTFCYHHFFSPMLWSFTASVPSKTYLYYLISVTHLNIIWFTSRELWVKVEQWTQ